MFKVWKMPVVFGGGNCDLADGKGIEFLDLLWLKSIK